MYDEKDKKSQQEAQEQAEIEAIVDNLTLFDDDLMSKCFDKNIPAAEHILRVILGRDDIHVTKVTGQSTFKSPLVGGREIWIDAEVETEDGDSFDVEVQRSNSGAHPRRLRFHSSMLDARMLKEKQKFTDLKDSYVIFITEKDYYKQGKPLYKVKRVVEGLDSDFNDGSHIIYVNGAYQGDDSIGKLMHDFHCKKADDIHNPTLAKSVRHFKEDGGRVEMCEAVKKYADEREKQGEARGREAGILEGEARGEVRGKILITIQMGLEYGANKEKIISDLQSKAGLTEEEALKEYDKYMSMNV